MDGLIRKILIIGGGTAGWMAATYLSKSLNGRVDITLVEAPSIPRIGVGEATVPNLQPVFFDALGIPEEEWMRGCNAAFKGAVKFMGWRKDGEHFYHPFGIVPNCHDVPLTHYWLDAFRRGQLHEGVDYCCFREPALLDDCLSPRSLDGTRSTRYAWHFDAQLVAAYLTKLGVNWGVNHIVAEIRDVQLAEDGRIQSVQLADGRSIEAELFIDCSGFRRLLIGKALGEPFIDMSDHLLCDSAVATSLPLDGETDGVEPYTSAIAMRHGWTWKIPMIGRIGTGYVYSSNFVSRDEATDEFLRLWSIDSQAPLNQIRFHVGRNRRAWVKNCVSIGLASCFVEPLESTGIYFIYAAVYQLAKLFPDLSLDERLITEFNRRIAIMFDDTIDFIQAHYLFSSRDDTPFWISNKFDLRMSDGLKQKIELYDAGIPINMPHTDEEAYYKHFEIEFENFWTNGSYFCILAGMGRLPEFTHPLLRYRPDWHEDAQRIFSRIRCRRDELRRSLPSNWEYLSKLHGHVMARVPALDH